MALRNGVLYVNSEITCQEADWETLERVIALHHKISKTNAEILNEVL